MTKVFGLLIIALGLATSTSAQQKRSNAPYFFIQISDPQFGMFENNKGFGKETALYEKAVTKINRLKPDFVVITGDLVNDRKNRAQIAEFKRITKEIDANIPVYLTPGNHDVGNEPDSAGIEAYIQDYGYEWFSFEHKNSLFVGFNSNFIKAHTPYYEQAQYEWLKSVLAKGKNSDHIILFCHYPFFIKTFDEPVGYFNIDLKSREKYFDLFGSNHVDAIFSGHLHKNANAKYGNIQLVTTSALGKPLGDDPSGFRIVKVYHDRIESTYYGLDEVPSSIVFDKK